MKLLEDPYNRISSGEKTIEIRLLDKKRQELEVGDTIEFSKLPELNETIKVETVDLLKYNSFEELVNDCSMECFGYPQGYSINRFLNSIYSIYSKDKEKEFGVLGIQIKLLNSK